jgi:hypothetical protein
MNAVDCVLDRFDATDRHQHLVAEQRRLMQRACRETRLRVHRHPPDGGERAALAAALREVRALGVIVMYADLSPVALERAKAALSRIGAALDSAQWRVP